jgi:O-antigen biosynthesis protein WbqP
MIRFFDFFFSLIGLILGLPVLLLLIMIGWFDTGSPIFLQKRVGRFQKPFTLVKFRTMKIGTACVGTHLASRSSITLFGGFLRRTKLDELPQLWNVFKGDMSLVGPRPCLLNQTELIIARQKCGVFETKPGITGLSQIQGIDMSTPTLLAETDQLMLESLDVRAYFRYIFLTLIGKGNGDRIRI